MTSELIRQLQRGRSVERIEAAQRLSWMRLLESEVREVARLLADESNEMVQKYLVEALARHGDRALQEAVEAGCNYRVRLKMVGVPTVSPELLVWLFERERSQQVKCAIVDKLSQMAHCDALRRLAARVRDCGDHELRRKMVSALARIGFEREQPDLVWRALVFDATAAAFELANCASRYVSLSPVQQKMLLVVSRDPQLDEYYREWLSRYLRQGTGELEPAL